MVIYFIASACFFIFFRCPAFCIIKISHHSATLDQSTQGSQWSEQINFTYVWLHAHTAQMCKQPTLLFPELKDKITCATHNEKNNPVKSRTRSGPHGNILG